MKIAIGSKIKAQREQREWSQQALAERLHVTRQTVSKWELGKSYPNLEDLVTLARLFEVSADYLLGMTQPVAKRSWFGGWFHKKTQPRERNQQMDADKWYSSGANRVQVATAVMMDLVANLNQTSEAPFRQLIGQYYDELLRQQSGSSLYVFGRMGLEISTCLRENGIVLSPENTKRVKQLLSLNHVRYM